MKVIKIAVTFACSFLIVLCSLIVFIENPEKELFEKTVKSLMVHEGLSCFQEVLDSFPELKDINSKIKRISYLKNSVHSLTGGPASNVSKEEGLYIIDCTHEIRQLQRNIKEELSQLIVIYTANET